MSGREGIQQIMTITESEAVELKMDLGQIPPTTVSSTSSTIKSVGLSRMQTEMAKLKTSSVVELADNLSSESVRPSSAEENDSKSGYPGSIASSVKTKRRAASQKKQQTSITEKISSSKYEPVANPIILPISSLPKEELAETSDETGVKKVEVKEPMPNYSESIPQDKCSNCLQTFEEGVEPLSHLIIGDGEMLNIPILEALCSIFRITKPNPIHMVDTPVAEQPHQLLLFCKVCNESLVSLYSSFNSFMDLVKEGSFLRTELDKLDDEIIKLRKKGTSRGKHSNQPKTVFKDEDDENEDEEFITGDIYSSDDEEFQASPSDLATIGLQSSSSSGDEEDFEVLLKHKGEKGPRKALRLTKTSARDPKKIANDDISDRPPTEDPQPHKKKKSRSLEEMTYQCSVCDANFLQAMQLRRHLRCHRKTTRTLSNQIGVGIDGQTDEQNITMSLLHRCSTCTQCFENDDLLLQHECHSDKAVQEAVKEPYKCTSCQQSFRSADLLRVHFRIEHGQQSRRYKGKKSTITGVHPEPIKKNITKHKPEIKFCEFCGKKFARQDQLTEHLRVHTKEKPFQCNVCDKYFAGRRGLSYHSVTHTSDRKYCCTVCGKRFKRLHHLNDHENSHKTDERPFVCEICGKCFKLKKHLNAHVSNHEGLKEHHCEICDKAFSRKDNLRQHARKVHGKALQEGSGSSLAPGETILVTSIATTIPTTIIDNPNTGTALPTEGTQLETIDLDHIVYINL